MSMSTETTRFMNDFQLDRNASRNVRSRLTITSRLPAAVRTSLGLDGNGLSGADGFAKLAS
jgi:hypothetical protein